MQFINAVKKYKLSVFIVLLILVIVGLTLYLYSPSLFSFPFLQKNTPLTANNLKGYDALFQKVAGISDTKLAQNSEYGRAIKYLLNVKTDKTRDQQYSDFEISWGLIVSAYASSNENKIYQMAPEYRKFAEANFPEKLKIGSFKILCTDPKCADSKMPSEIQNVIEQIKNSSAPDYVKQILVRNLTNATYVSVKNPYQRAFAFMLAANQIKQDYDMTKLLLNDKLSNEVRNYVKITDPKDYKDIVPKEPTLTPTIVPNTTK